GVAFADPEARQSLPHGNGLVRHRHDAGQGVLNLPDGQDHHARPAEQRAEAGGPRTATALSRGDGVRQTPNRDKLHTTAWGGVFATRNARNSRLVDGDSAEGEGTFRNSVQPYACPARREPPSA